MPIMLAPKHAQGFDSVRNGAVSSLLCQNSETGKRVAAVKWNFPLLFLGVREAIHGHGPRKFVMLNENFVDGHRDC